MTFGWSPEPDPTIRLRNSSKAYGLTLRCNPGYTGNMLGEPHSFAIANRGDLMRTAGRHASEHELDLRLFITDGGGL